MSIIKQSDFNKLMIGFLDNLPSAESADLTDRTNLSLVGFSAVRGGGRQLRKMTMQTLLRQALMEDVGEKRIIVTLSQAAGAAPTVAELVDDPVTVLTPARTSAGLFTFTAATAIFVAGTRVKIHQNVPGSVFTAELTSTTVITVTSRTEDGTSKLLVATDDLLATTLLEVTIPSAL